jgi:hypothetical protein
VSVARGGRADAAVASKLLEHGHENEMPPSLRLPHMDEATVWVTALPERTCPGTVKARGRHPAVAPDGSEHTRGMFVVIRD